MPQGKEIYSTPMRQNLIISPEERDGFDYIDVGTLLAMAIKDSLNDGNLPAIAETSLNAIISNNIRQDSSIGKYVALKNIGILFEPQLHLNLASIFEQQSKNQTLIICAKGTIREKRFHFEEDESCAINLSGLTYKQEK